ncbi:MAG: hypothetical protein E5V74_03535, partial [Mesorhizobium sp.]
LDRLGATQRCRLPGYGRNGEDFFLYDWTRPSKLGESHVSLSKTTGTEAAAAGADRAGQGRPGAGRRAAR